MIKPLQDSYVQGYKHGQKTFYSDKHLGIDWICREGLPIYSPEDGKIINLYSGQGGNTIVLRSNSYTHRFMHLSKFNVKQNDNVKAGQVIGYTGNTGMSTASHLHWDSSKGDLQLNNFNNFVDPLSFKFTNLPTNNNDMEKKEVKAIVEALYWSFGKRQPDTEGVSFWTDEYFREGEKSKWTNRILEGLRKEKVNQGIRFLDADLDRWRTLADVKGEK